MHEKLRLIVILVYIGLIQLGIYHTGFTDISGDGFFRALMTYEWRMAPSIVSRDFGVFSLFWFPPYFWLTGAVYWLTDGLTFSLKLLSYVSSLLGLLVLYRLSCQLTNKRAATITVLLVGTIPFHLWLSLSMAETSLFLLLVLLGFQGFLNWIQQHKITPLLGASVSFLGCSMLRPEGWVLAGMFSISVGYFLLRQRNGNRLWLIVSALLPITFGCFWLADNWIFYGSPFHFMTAQINHIGSKEYSAAIKWSRAFQPLFFMFVLSPLLAMTVFAGIIVAWKSAAQETRKYLVFVLLYLFALSALFLLGLGTTASPLRYGLVPLVLLVPFAGWLVSRGFDSSRGVKLAVFSLLVFALATHLTRSLKYSNPYRDVIAAADYIAASSDSSQPTLFKRIATEFELRYFVGDLPTRDRDTLTLQSEHGAILAYSGHPDRFLTKPLKLGTRNAPVSESRTTARQTGVLTALLKKNAIDTVIVSDRRLMEMLPPAFKLLKTFGRYVLMTLQSELPQPGEDRHGLTPAGTQLQPGIRLVGHHYDGELYPVNLVLHWAFDQAQDSKCSYQVWVKAVLQGDESVQVIKRIRPIFCWYDLSEPRPAEVVEDYLPLDLPGNLPGGTYKISVALLPVTEPVSDLAQEPTPPAEDILWLDLQPTRLVFSRRSVLTDHLTGRNQDWFLLLQVLYSL